MIVSPGPKFIYCRLPKTGSTSVSDALDRYRSPVERAYVARAVHKFSRRTSRGIFMPFRDYSHFPMAGAKARLSSDFFSSAWKFTVARHPEAWILSYFHHVLRPDFPDEYVEAFGEARRHADLDYFLDWLQDRPSRPLSTMLIGDDGDYLVDQVVRLERLETELAQVERKIGVRLAVGHKNVGGYRKTDLTASQMKRVERLFAADYEAFGYLPGGGLTDTNLRATAATRKIASELGASGLERFDIWKPFSPSNYGRTQAVHSLTSYLRRRSE